MSDDKETGILLAYTPDQDDDDRCVECGEDVGLSSHYHCPNCRGVCSCMGHLGADDRYSCHKAGGLP